MLAVYTLIYVIIYKILRPHSCFIIEGIILILFASIPYRHNLLENIIFILFFIEVIIDLWFKESYSLINIMILIASLWLKGFDISILWGAILPLILLIINKYYKIVIGDGDIELLFCLLPLLGIYIFWIFYLASLMAGLVIILSYLFKKPLDKIAFFPFLLLACLSII